LLVEVVIQKLTEVVWELGGICRMLNSQRIGRGKSQSDLGIEAYRP